MPDPITPPPGYTIDTQSNSIAPPPGYKLDAKPDSAADFAKAFLQNSPVGAIQGSGNALLHPVQAVKGALQQNQDLLDKAHASFQQGDYTRAMFHTLNYLLNGVPGLGAAIDDAQEDFLKGHYAIGTAKTLGLASTLAVGEKLPQITEGAVNAANAAQAKAAPLVGGLADAAKTVKDVSTVIHSPNPVAKAAAVKRIWDRVQVAPDSAAPTPVPSPADLARQKAVAETRALARDARIARVRQALGVDQDSAAQSPVPEDPAAAPPAGPVALPSGRIPGNVRSTAPTAPSAETPFPVPVVTPESVAAAPAPVAEPVIEAPQFLGRTTGNEIPVEAGGRYGAGFGIYRVPIDRVRGVEDISQMPDKMADAARHAQQIEAGSPIPPLWAVAEDDGAFRVEGARRLAAAKMAGQTHVPIALYSDFAEPAAASPPAEPNSPPVEPKSDLEDLLERSLQNPRMAEDAKNELEQHLRQEALAKTAEIVDRKQTARALKLGKFLQELGFTADHIARMNADDWAQVGQVAGVDAPSEATIQKTKDLMQLGRESPPTAAAPVPQTAPSPRTAAKSKPKASAKSVKRVGDLQQIQIR